MRATLRTAVTVRGSDDFAAKCHVANSGQRIGLLARHLVEERRRQQERGDAVVVQMPSQQPGRQSDIPSGMPTSRCDS